MRISRVRGAAATHVFLLIAVALALTACGPSATTDSASAGSSGGGASKYGYTPAGFTQCLDDHHVRYRQDGQGGLTLVDQGDAATQAAADECNRLTTRPAANGESARNNRIERGIADCLKGLGYHVTASKDGHYVDGTPAVSLSVPKAEEDSSSFRTDMNDCTHRAEQANPEGSS